MEGTTPTINVDNAEEIFLSHFKEWQKKKHEIETEQDTRFKIIDIILTEVIGWSRDEIKTEPHTDSGYIDYLLRSSDGSRLVVEAKKTGVNLVDTKQPGMSWYKVGGPVLKSARDGLEQAKRYCTDEAVLFSALTTGLQWIGFWALRPDGVKPLEGKAAVFPNLKSIREDFALFYDLFSREGISSKLYQAHVHESEGMQIRHSEPLTAVYDKDDIHLLNKSRLTADLENIYRRFFSTMSAEDDPDMLAECFVESKQSKEADDQLRKITRNLINQVDVVYNRGSAPGANSDSSRNGAWGIRPDYRQ